LTTQISIEVTGAAELRDALNRAAQRLESPRDLLASLGGVLEARIQRRFDSKRDPSGAAWAPLARSTREKYDREDTNPRDGQRARRGSLLERTRRMRNSLASNVVGEDTVEVGMHAATDGGTYNLALLHEFGTRNMPRRGLYLADPDSGTLGADDEAALLAEISGFLDDVFGV
jgi:phage gpG-like protein